jgi:hypothetical protein
MVFRTIFKIWTKKSGIERSAILLRPFKTKLLGEWLLAKTVLYINKIISIWEPDVISSDVQMVPALEWGQYSGVEFPDVIQTCMKALNQIFLLYIK